MGQNYVNNQFSREIEKNIIEHVFVAAVVGTLGAVVQMTIRPEPKGPGRRNQTLKVAENTLHKRYSIVFILKTFIGVLSTHGMGVLIKCA